MRLTRQKKQASVPHLNMAAMIDVVFLLLIFFMCTSAWRPPEEELPAQLPQTGKAAETVLEEFEPVRIRVGRVEDGVQVNCDGQPCDTFEQLAALLRARRAIADVPVIIEGQGSVPFGYMVGAMDACYRADLTKVAFSTKGVRL